MVTEANLEYVGSITIDGVLVEKAGLFEGEIVHINNVRNGAHWETYIIKAPNDSGIVCLNGPPAHHFKRGDLIIVWGQEAIELKEARDHIPTVVFVHHNEKLGVFNRFDRLTPGTHIPKKRIPLD